jgi:hypothetical protein
MLGLGVKKTYGVSGKQASDSFSFAVNTAAIAAVSSCGVGGTNQDEPVSWLKRR